LAVKEREGGNKRGGKVGARDGANTDCFHLQGKKLLQGDQHIKKGAEVWGFIARKKLKEKAR